MAPAQAQTERLSPTWLIAMTALSLLAALGYLTGFSPATVLAAIVGLTEGGMALLIVVSAGGFAYPLVRRLAGPDSDPLLRVVTAAAIGLWMTSTAMLVAGSLTTGLLRAWLWWPLMAAGVLLAAWQGRARMESIRLASVLDGRSLTWVAIALAAGIWLAGATQPPGFLDFGWGDSYDVLEYHLQVPREYYLAQHISPLDHNVYSHYPLGVEMLFLLGMVLRGGAYEGMYLAKLMHGAFLALGVAGVFAGLRRDQDSRARYAAVLLATAPLLLYLSWLGMVELAQVCYLALALVWLRAWLADRRAGQAAIVGTLLGAACATKYLAVGLVAGPVLAVMLGWCLARPRLLGQWVLAGLMTLVLFCPWLIRNTISTANPVFPLGTQVFARDGFAPMHNQRWLAGHGPAIRPPVPVPPGYPPGYEPPARRPTRLEMFYSNFLAQDLLNPLLVMLAGVGLALYLAGPAQAGGWNWTVLAVLGLQLGVWAGATHEMPARFIAPALAPMALIGADVLARLAQLHKNPFARRQGRQADTPWGRVAAVAVLAVTALVNVIVASAAHEAATARTGDRNGMGGEVIAGQFSGPADMHQGDRLMLVGESRAFYAPPGTIYATGFGTHPLIQMAQEDVSAAEALARLRAMGVTRIWVDWYEILRLATTYGFDPPAGADVVTARLEGSPPSLKILEDLKGLGLRRVEDIRLDEPATRPAAQSATGPAPTAATNPASSATTARVPAPAPTTSAPAPQTWPIVTIYALPK